VSRVESNPRAFHLGKPIANEQLLEIVSKGDGQGPAA
jgi:hypothetical protein